MASRRADGTTGASDVLRSRNGRAWGARLIQAGRKRGDRAPRLLVQPQWPLWAVLLVGVGIALRVRQYFAERSLWGDESFLALELIDNSPSELLGPLGFNQGAPFGFLLAEKAIAELLGYSELALRLLPLAAGLLAVLLFVPVARRSIAADAVPLAVGLVVVAEGLINYSSEVKQYSVDVVATAYVLATALPLARGEVATRRTLLLALGVVPLVWLSHAALFVTAAAGAVIVAASVATRLPRRPVRFAVVAAWALSCLLVVVTAPDYDELREAQAAQGGVFVNRSGGLADPSWITAFGGEISDGIGLPLEDPWASVSKVLAAVALIGFVSFVRRRDGVLAAMLGLPIALTIAGSALGLYPLYARTLLFLVPIVALLVGQGVVELASLLGRRRRAGVLVLSVLVVAAPAREAVMQVVDRPPGQELKPALAYVRDHWRNGDVLYLGWGDQHAYLYYLRCGCFDLEAPTGARLPSAVVPLEGSATQNYAAFVSATPSLVVARYHPYDEEARAQDLDRLRGRGRVWVVSAHVFLGSSVAFRDEVIPRRLDRFGRRLDAFMGEGGRAYLYDFSA